MAFKFGKNFDEMCYPFMYESLSLCDFEVITDELCGHIGAIISHLPDNMPDIAADLEQIQPLAFHINGSIRGRLAVSEEDQAWLQARLNHYKEKVADRLQESHPRHGQGRSGRKRRGHAAAAHVQYAVQLLLCADAGDQPAPWGGGAGVHQPQLRQGRLTR